LTKKERSLCAEGETVEAPERVKPKGEKLLERLKGKEVAGWCDHSISVVQQK